MNILCIGDVVGKPGRNAIQLALKDIVEEERIDFVIVNGENIAGGAGITAKLAEELLNSGCDVITSGDHIWDQKDMVTYLSTNPFVLKPDNFPEDTPGKGWHIAETKKGIKVGVINLLGRVFTRYNIRCPFKALEKLTKQLKKETHIIIVDFHAEATSEKIALGHFADGKVSAVFGTHTHVQTADEKILSKGTAYITDIGMTGPEDSVIGQDKNIIIERFLKSMPIKFHVASGNAQINGIILDIDELTGKAKRIRRISKEVVFPS